MGRVWVGLCVVALSGCLVGPVEDYLGPETGIAKVRRGGELTGAGLPQRRPRPARSANEVEHDRVAGSSHVEIARVAAAGA